MQDRLQHITDISLGVWRKHDYTTTVHIKEIY